MKPIEQMCHDCEKAGVKPQDTAETMAVKVIDYLDVECPKCIDKITAKVIEKQELIRQWVSPIQ